MVGGDGVLSQVESQTIEVGDVVRLEEDDVVPADLGPDSTEKFWLEKRHEIPLEF